MNTLNELSIDELGAVDTEFRDALADLEHQFSVMFAQVRAQMRERAKKVHPDLSPAGYHVLRFLVQEGSQRAGALAEYLDWDKSAVSRLVKQLLTLDLIERQADPADGRSFLLLATDSAAAKVQAISAGYRRRIRQTLAGWQVAEVRQLADLLRRLSAIEPDRPTGSGATVS